MQIIIINKKAQLLIRTYLEYLHTAFGYKLTIARTPIAKLINLEKVINDAMSSPCYCHLSDNFVSCH
ncbi:hypothetical protein C4K35_3309 [Pseudomonas chlororaphis subsp. piscium]|nr:hypothetical protein C4K35_3309 [Pseudomonas chlororaphis subsp. piscium]AZC57464.1 hypothetical protein C4K34_3299 [Pseudomonas chlororaphis subsp. piscium]AZC76170.1 hypothetical protein C4K31_3267 [Pseudomonas chlororaphis subsp. piscium]AZC95979.1 hypothetical protein C4K28_3251 [Pseudomonas chlororaphis subsp. piscium]